MITLQNNYNNILFYLDLSGLKLGDEGVVKIFLNHINDTLSKSKNKNNNNVKNSNSEGSDIMEKREKQ